MAYTIPSIAGRNNIQWKHFVDQPHPDDVNVASYASNNGDDLDVVSWIGNKQPRSTFTLQTTNFPVPPSLGPEDEAYFEHLTPYRRHSTLGRTAYHEYADGVTTISGSYRTHKRAMIAAEAMSNRLKEGRNPRTGRPTK